MMKNIGTTTMVLGGLLCLVGLAGRFLTDTTSVTAFIPLFFGVPLIILGGLAQRGGRTRLWVMIALGIAVLGGLGSSNVVPDLLSGSAMSASVLSRGAMLVLCVVLAGLDIGWLLRHR